MTVTIYVHPLVLLKLVVFNELKLVFVELFLPRLLPCNFFEPPTPTKK